MKSEQAVTGLKGWQTVYEPNGNLTTISTVDLPTPANQWRKTIVQTAPDTSRVIQVSQLGQVLSTERQDSLAATLSRTDYTFDEFGRTRQVVDARNGAQTMQYNSVDLLVTNTTPPAAAGQSGQVTVYSYTNVAGRYLVKETTLPDASHVYQEYGDLGQVKRQYGSRTYPVAYTYDAQGRMETMTTWTNCYGFNWRRIFGRIESVTGRIKTGHLWALQNRPV